MDVIVSKSSLMGTIDAIPSKSFAHRAMICDFLANKTVTEYDFSEDVIATANCLKAILSGEVLNANESGSTLRFLLPVVASIGGNFVFTGSQRLLERPLDELFSALNSHGVSVQKKDNKIFVSGKLTAGEYNIRGDISSQYLTGLLLALPNLNGDSVIKLTTALESRPYIDITLEVLKNYGVNIVEENGAFIIKGNQIFKGKNHIEGDWSNASFWLVAGAINGKITVNNLNANSVQGDRKIIEIIKKAGGKISLVNNSVTVEKSKLKAFLFDFKNFPDLVPICAVLASKTDGVCYLKNVERLRLKESDRIASTLAFLTNLGIDAKYEKSDLIVKGGAFSGGTVSSFNDHRITMSAIIAGLTAKNEVEITGAEAIKKSYPNFIDDLILLGGKANANG